MDTPLTELQALGQAFDAECGHGRITEHQANHLADMARTGPTEIPVCKACGRILCDHPDLVAAGLAPVGGE